MIGQIERPFGSGWSKVSSYTSNGERRNRQVAILSTHLHGGAIMGTSPETSVVNTWLQHWNAPNLFVIGGSAFPQNASGNPTLTALALTYRAADALIARYLKSPDRWPEG